MKRAPKTLAAERMTGTPRSCSVAEDGEAQTDGKEQSGKRNVDRRIP
jgi:hypothetical protein